MANEILGTNIDDRINGTADDDIIKTFEGDDVVIAGGGDDEVYTGLGDDRLEGGAGDDYLVSNEGDDILLGGAGSDRLFGCEDDDILDGGAGQDFLNAGIGNDILIFNAAENSGSRAPDYYSGLEGIDTLVLELTQAEFTAAQADIAAFLDYVSQTTQANGESVGAFFRFQTLNLAVQEVENLEIIVDGDVVFTTNPQAADDDFTTSEQGVIDGSVALNDDVNPGSTFTVVQNVANGTLVLSADGSFTFDTNGAFAGLDDGETATETFIYRVSSPNSDDVTATATITITGQNDAPVVTTIDAEESEDAASFIVDLLAGASDADTNDSLSVTNVRLDDGTSIVSVPSNNTGLAERSSTANANAVNGGKLAIDLSLYQYLAVGETLTLTVSYDVSDGTTTTPNTAVLTIIGENDIPVVASAITAEIDEGSSPIVIDMLAGASDIDASDVLSVTDFEIVSGNAAGLVQNGSSLTVDPGAYSDLNAGDTETVVISYVVTDGNGGTVTQTATITVNGEGAPPNNAPIVTAPIVITLQETDGVTAIDLLAGASDPDGDTLFADTPILLSGDGIGAFTTVGSLSVDGTAYASALNDGDTETLIYMVQISDGNGGTVTQSVTVNIVGAGSPPIAVNDPPVIDFSIDIFTQEDVSPETIFLTDGVSDPNGDTLSIINLTGLGAGLNYDTSTFQLDLDPSSAFFQSLAVGDTASYTLTYDVIDGNGGSVSRVTTIDVEGVNDDPLAGAPIVVELDESDGMFTQDLLLTASDVDSGDVLDITNITLISGNPDGVDFTGPNTSILNVDPSEYSSLDAGETEVIVISYDVIDGNGGIASNTITITINGEGVGVGNQSPFEDSSINVVRAEDSQNFMLVLTDGMIDPDGDTLDITNLTGLNTDVMMFDTATNTVTVNPSHASFQSLAVGSSSSFTLNYNVIDGNGGAFARTTTIDIQGVNDNPIAGTPLNLTFSETDSEVSPDYLLGATDVDIGDTLTVSNFVVTSGDGRGFAFSDGIFSPMDYASLNAGESEVITITYDINDNNGGSVSTTATFTINGVGGANTPPVSNEFAQIFVSEGGTSFAGAAQGASDADGDTLTAINLPSLPSWLTFDAVNQRFDADGTDPIFDSLRVGQSLDFTYFYDLSDGNGGMVEHGISIIVDGTNDNPVVAAPLTLTTSEDFSFDFLNLLTGASDVDDGDMLSIRNVTGLNPGFDVDYTFGELLIFPSDAPFDFIRVNQTFDFVISYEIHDLFGGFTTQTATITIEGINDNPLLGGALSGTVVDNGTGGANVFNLLQGAIDPESTALTVSNFMALNTLPSGVFTFDAATGTLTVDTSSYGIASEPELFSFTYEVTDADGGTVTQSIDITLVDTFTSTGNNAPTATPIVLTFTEDTLPLSIDLLQSASDPDGDTLSAINLGALPPGFTFDAANNLVNIFASSFQSLNANDTVTVNATYTIEDGFISFGDFRGLGGSVENTLSITVQGVNDAPTNFAPLSRSFSEDDGFIRIDLLSNSNDVDNGDVLNVDGFPSTGGLQGTRFDGERYLAIELDSFAYQSLAAGESADYNISYTVADGNGGSVTQTGVITIVGANDVATAFNNNQFNFNDTDAAFSADLSNFIDEIDTNDAYTLDSVSFISGVGITGTPSFTFTGGVFSFDPGQFGPGASSLLRNATFEFTATSGPDSITSTFTIVINGTLPGQEPIDDTTIYTNVVDPDDPIVKYGPDGVYAGGLDDDVFGGDTGG